MSSCSLDCMIEDTSARRIKMRMFIGVYGYRVVVVGGLVL